MDGCSAEGVGNEIAAVGSQQELGGIAAADREMSGRRNSAIGGTNGHANTHVLSSSRLPDLQLVRAESGDEPIRSALERVLSRILKRQVRGSGLARQPESRTSRSGQAQDRIGFRTSELSALVQATHGCTVSR